MVKAILHFRSNKATIIRAEATSLATDKRLRSTSTLSNGVRKRATMNRARHANMAAKAVLPNKRAAVVEPTSTLQTSSAQLGDYETGSDKSELPTSRESLLQIDWSQQSDLDGSNNTVSTDFSSCCVSTGNGKQVRFADDDADDNATRTPQQQAQSHTVIAYLPLPHEMESEQRNALWWNQRDYVDFSNTAKNIARQVRQHPALTSGLEEAYRQAEVVSRKVKSVQDADPYLDSMVFETVRFFRFLPYLTLLGCQSRSRVCFTTLWHTCATSPCSLHVSDSKSRLTHTCFSTCGGKIRTMTGTGTVVCSRSLETRTGAFGIGVALLPPIGTS